MSNLIGVDEAGRGPVIGPLVVAGFKLSSPDKNRLLEELRVKDSKRLSPKRREYLSQEIVKIGEFRVKIVTAAEIDKGRLHKTLNVMEGEYFSEVINQLAPDEHSTIIVDSADANENTFKNYIEANVPVCDKIISMHKADDIHLVVAAASIIAKTMRDSEVVKIGKELNSEIGSGYPADPITRNFLEKWIKEKGDLPPHTRRSWNTAKKLINDHRTPIKALDQFK